MREYCELTPKRYTTNMTNQWIDFDPSTGKGHIVSPVEPTLDEHNLDQFKDWLMIRMYQEVIRRSGATDYTIENYIKLCNLYTAKYDGN